MENLLLMECFVNYLYVIVMLKEHTHFFLPYSMHKNKANDLPITYAKFLSFRGSVLLEGGWGNLDLRGYFKGPPPLFI